MTRASDLAKLLGAGATINDGTTITTADNTSQLTLTSTDADASGGPLLTFYRNSASPADSDATGKINFHGENSAGEDTTYAQIFTSILDVTDGTEDGRFKIGTLLAGSFDSRLDMTNTETVFNEDSKDLDFRVESNADTHALFVEGGTSNVCINVATGNSANNGSLTIGHSGITKITGAANGNADELILIGANASANVGMSIISNNANQGIIYFGDEDDTDIGGIIYDHSTNDLAFQTNTSEKLRVKSGGDLSIIDGNLVVASGHGIDFSAASNNSGVTSELLDDYEEGTYTILEPSGQATITNNRVHYTKIGRLVTVQASITVGSNSNTNTLNLNLPFASTINGYYLGGGNIGYTTASSSYVNNNMRPNIENAADNVFFITTSNTGLTCANLSGIRIDFAISYYT